MWYLQNEVVSGAYGPGVKFGIARILRLKVTMKATQPLLDRKLNFGLRVAFDSAKCAGPHCEYVWATFGYNVGCNKFGSYPYPAFETHFSGGIWYSLPGQCPSKSFMEKDAHCRSQEPGGMCASPTGTWNCTWTYENAGELALTELYAGTDAVKFWSNATDDAANAKKVEVARDLFAAKYGPDLPAPPCDFDQLDFYRGSPYSA